MYLKDKLNNGIRVVMEKILYVNSVSIGILMDNGSAKEDKHLNGISHFIEHMLFKGTKNRTAKDLVGLIDNIGGQINAFTGTEYTCFYIKVLDNHLPIAIEVLSDMINNSKFDYEDIEKEKGVVYEEIKMYLDSPEDIVYDLLSEIMFEDTPLALPILGSLETVGNLNRESILQYFNQYYTPQNMVISIAGNFEPKDTLKVLNEKFYKNLTKDNKDNNSLNSFIPSFSQKLNGKLKDTEQLNFCLGMEGVKRGSDDLYPLLVMNNIFGGSMSSRLFQEIREEKGLVYSVYSHPTSFKNIGTFTIYAGLSVDQVINVAKLINENIESVRANLITKDELEKSKEQLKGNYILGMEGTFSRMFDMGKSELLLGRILSPKEILSEIDMVSMEDIERVILDVFNKYKYNIAYVGNISNTERIDKNLKEIFFNWGDIMKIQVINKSPFPLPKPKTSGSAGIDLCANIERLVLKPLDRALIPTGLYLSIPEGCEGQIRARSGLALKHGISLANGIGTIDSDYRGEIKVILINLGKEEYIINKGDRIAQLVIIKYEKVELYEVDFLDKTKRGSKGFGHTGY